MDAACAAVLYPAQQHWSARTQLRTFPRQPIGQPLEPAHVLNPCPAPAGFNSELPQLSLVKKFGGSYSLVNCTCGHLVLTRVLL